MDPLLDRFPIAFRPTPFPIPDIWKRTIIDLNCKSRILIVTDSFLSFDPASGFGLSEAVEIVKDSGTTNHPVEVTLAHWSSDSHADVENFRFAGTHTVDGDSRTIRYYEEIWIFAAASASAVSSSMGGADLDALVDFMDAGGGVFATGDHAQLGAYLCGAIPRVGSMRRWYTSAGAPDGSDASTRIDTNVPNEDVGAVFDLQSDATPQRIFPKWYSDSGVTLPHELLTRHDVDGAVTFLPDHPHEGKVVEPSSLDSSEYPSGIAPEIVAWGVSGGPGTSSKAPVTPTLFGVIGAYDGHLADVGRVVVDSTWHHWVNINLNGTGATPLPAPIPTEGLYDAAGDPTPEYEQIQDYFQNIAGWLEPNRLRICFLVLVWPILRWSWPVVEHLKLEADPKLPDLMGLGRDVIAQLKSIRGASPEEAVTLLTADMELDEGLQIFLNPRLQRGRTKLRRFGEAPLLKREAVTEAILGGSMWVLAKKLPESLDDGVKAVRKMLKVKKGEPSPDAVLRVLRKGARHGLEMVAEEVARPKAGLADLKRALRS